MSRRPYTTDRNSTAWQSNSGSSTLESLLEVVDASNKHLGMNGIPWRAGHELIITGQGGLYDREDRRVSLVRGTYTNEVTKNSISDIRGGYSFKSDATLSLTIGPTANTETVAGSGIIGLDSLTVDGNANVSANDKMITILNAPINRIWKGGISRVAGMEGVICAGYYSRIYAGAILSICPLISGDVYGGCARFAGARISMAILNYRSVDACIWNTQFLNLKTKTTFIPPLVRKKPPISKKKWLFKGILGACPFFEILLGILSIPVAIFSLILSMSMKAYNKIKKIISPTPRISAENSPVTAETVKTEMST